MAKPNINITVISDIICPWCWVGKKKLDQAIDASKDKYNIRVTYEPFQLKPDVPPEGQDKPVVPPGKSRVSAALKEAGELVGIDFTGKADRFPFTIPAHALIEYAQQFEKHTELSELLYKVYFTDGVFLDTDTLVSLGVQIGLDEEGCRNAVTESSSLDRLAAKARLWRNKDIKGVPCYFMNGIKTFQGSRSTEEFISMFGVVAQNYPQ